MKSNTPNPQCERDKPVVHTDILPIEEVYRCKHGDLLIWRSLENTQKKICDGTIGWVNVPDQEERHFCFYLKAKGVFLSPAAYSRERENIARANKKRRPYWRIRFEREQAARMHPRPSSSLWSII